MASTTHFTSRRDADESYDAHLQVLEDTYATLNGVQHPLSAAQSGVHPADRPDLAALFPPAFISAHTDYETWTAFATAASVDLTSRADLVAASRTELDEVVRSQSEFDTAPAFFRAATEHHLDREGASA